MKKVLAAAALLGLAAGNVAYAQNQPYFGVKGGLMMPDLSGADDAINIGGLVGIKIQDLPASSGLRGSLAVEGELTMSVIEGDVGSDGEWDILTLAGYGVYRSQPLNGSMYFKGKVGLAYQDISSDIPASQQCYTFFGTTTCMTVPGYSYSQDDIGISFGVGLGFKMGPRNNLEVEYTVLDDVDFLSVGMTF